MNITVIYSTARHGSTWNIAQLYLKRFAKNQEITVTEFTLPKDMPSFCVGCFGCITRGEQNCPHARNVDPIVSALKASDLIILTSPVYGMDVSGSMKALLDHLCFMWMSHRPESVMFQKTALTIVTTAGAGLGHTTKTMVNSLKFWGVRAIFKGKYAVSALKWEDVDAKRRAKIGKSVERNARKIEKAVQLKEKGRVPLFTRVFFWMMSGMMKKNDYNLTDRNHWENQGWLNGARPF